MASGAQRRGQAGTAVVLVVEDEVLVRMAITLELSGSGYEVIEAADAAEALAVLEEQRVDLIFSDIQMPGQMNGIGLCRCVRERYPHVAVILTSAHGMPPLELPGPGPAFIPKPYLSTTVLRAVDSRIGSAEPNQAAGTG